MKARTFQCVSLSALTVAIVTANTMSGEVAPKPWEPYPPLWDLVTKREAGAKGRAAPGARARAARCIVQFPRSVALQVRHMLENQRLRRDDPQALCYAADVAGAFRLAECAPQLVRDIRLMRQANDFRLAYDVGRQWPDNFPAAKALMAIGKPAVPHLIEFACSEASDADLAVAGLVLKDIEGDLAFHVVEKYIESSDDPVKTRKLLERQPFRARWKPKETEARQAGKAESQQAENTPADETKTPKPAQGTGVGGRVPEGQ